MNDKNISLTIFSNMAWKLAERMGAQLVTMIVSIVLARLLLPSDFGVIALITVFINIAHVFVTHGFGNALIQKKNADNIDFSSVFFFNITFSLFIYVGFFFLAPVVASFYNMPILTPVLRVLSLRIPLASFDLVQQAYVARNLLFRKFFFATLSGTITSAIVGITMAYMGFGLWALVAQQLVSSAVSAAVLWFIVGWRPILAFSLKRMKEIFHFGWKILCSGLLDVMYLELTNLIIGKLYTAEDLGYYNNGNKYIRIVITNASDSICSVLFPALAKVQDQLDRVRTITRRAIKSTSYVIFPLAIWALVAAKPLVAFLMTEKWLPSVPMMQVACLTFLFYPLTSANSEAIKAIGNSGLYLKLEIVKKLFGLGTLLLSLRHGVMAIALSTTITACVSFFISAWASSRVIQYGLLRQLRDVLPALLLSVLMGAAVLGIGYFLQGHVHNFILLALQGIVGVAVYVGASVICKLESFYYLKDTLLGFLPKKTPVNQEEP